MNPMRGKEAFLRLFPYLLQPDFTPMSSLAISPAWLVILGWTLLSNAVGFLAMGLDKSRSQRGAWRVPERTLLTIAIIGGSFGIVVGSGLFRHKTLKYSFLLTVYIAAIIWLLILLELHQDLGYPSG